MDIKITGIVGGIFALPVCCIVPGVLSLLGLAGVTVAMSRIVAQGFMPLLLTISLIFLGRAHYFLYIKHEGNRMSHTVTWISTALALTVWGVQWFG